MPRHSGWLAYGRPQFFYLGSAVMVALSILGIALSAFEIWRVGLPWWGWVLIGWGALACLVYAHLRQWREQREEIQSLRQRIGGPIRLAYQEETSSSHAQAPYGVRAVFHADRVIPHTRFKIVCTGWVLGDLVEAHFVNTGGMYAALQQAGASPIVPIDISSPAFHPERPLIVELYGPTPFEVVGIGKSDR